VDFYKDKNSPTAGMCGRAFFIFNSNNSNKSIDLSISKVYNLSGSNGKGGNL